MLIKIFRRVLNRIPEPLHPELNPGVTRKLI
jgi:hypothetical protein